MTIPEPIRDYCSRTHEISWWGRTWQRQIALCDTVLGDGQLVVTFQTTDDRPHYYALLVDSSCWDDKEYDFDLAVLEAENGPFGLEAWIEALEQQFGRAWDSYDEDACEECCGECEWCEEQDFPKVALANGYSWGCWGSLDEVLQQVTPRKEKA